MSLDYQFEYFDKNGERWCRWKHEDTVLELPMQHMYDLAKVSHVFFRLRHCDNWIIVQAVLFWAEMIKNPD